MTYNETSTCPVCGSRSNVTIRAYGDYDGPAKPRETNPSNCPTCDGIKKANPEMWKMLSNLWFKLRAERKIHRKELLRRNKEQFAEHELYHPFHPIHSEDRFLKFFDTETDSNNACTKDKNGPWVQKTTMRSLIFEVAKTIAKQKKP